LGTLYSSLVFFLLLLTFPFVRGSGERRAEQVEKGEGWPRKGVGPPEEGARRARTKRMAIKQVSLICWF